MSLGAAFVKAHQDHGDTFPEWKLYESARSAHYLFAKRDGLTEKLTEDMASLADFTHARLNNSVVLQCLCGVGQQMVQTIYDGMDNADLDMLLLEIAKLCVT